MIRLSKLADYGIVLLSYLAGEPRQVLTARQLAGASLLPLPTVAKVLKALTRSGLLGSQRGLSGGYTLARPAAEISVVDVISALDGPVGMTSCTVVGGSCQLELACPVRRNWQLINQAVLGALRGLTVASLRTPQPIAQATLPLAAASHHPRKRTP